MSQGIVVLREQDVQAPDIYISNPTFGGIWPTTTSTLSLGGGSDDNTVTAITWSNNRGGSGQVSPPLDNWYVSGITLYPGTNILTVTAYDAAGNSGTDTLTVNLSDSKTESNNHIPRDCRSHFWRRADSIDSAAGSGLQVAFSVVSGPASISNNVLTLTGAGAVTVEASQSGDALFNPAPSMDVSFNVVRADQSVDFTAVPDKSAGDAPFALTAADEFRLAGVFQRCFPARRSVDTQQQAHLGLVPAR